MTMLLTPPRILSHKETLREQFDAGKPRVDRQRGILAGVKILGRESKNDNGQRVYSDEALDDAVKLYEGVGVNLNHPAPEFAGADRDVKDAIGQLRNVRREGDGIYGDLHVLKSHPHADALFEAAERMPNRFGLSHNAEGDVQRDQNGKNVVKNLTKVRSVDIVQRPATNAGLYEGDGFPVRESFEKSIFGSRARPRSGAEVLFEIRRQLREDDGDDDVEESSDDGLDGLLKKIQAAGGLTNEEFQALLARLQEDSETSESAGLAVGSPLNSAKFWGNGENVVRRVRGGGTAPANRTRANPIESFSESLVGRRRRASLHDLRESAELRRVASVSAMPLPGSVREFARSVR